jgi:hypothetical protein
LSPPSPWLALTAYVACVFIFDLGRRGASRTSPVCGLSVCSLDYSLAELTFLCLAHSITRSCAAGLYCSHKVGSSHDSPRLAHLTARPKLRWLVSRLASISSPHDSHIEGVEGHRALKGLGDGILARFSFSWRCFFYELTRLTARRVASRPHYHQT